MTRQMQELWLFGQLKTLDEKNGIQSRIDQDAKEVASLLSQLVTSREGKGVNGSDTTEGEMQDGN